ncbi:FAD-dependent monooxygenase [Pseudonocardia acidicola]|uniref:FAD-binding monooxygenase n=1 Tax=Pseudonocardia acidicola TaxID=2724939 RepID=A0ABX1SFA5_9PSEU|nr:FAD-dependent monooxygenase [Pseudonocardia acidicola]NMI00240.1 FAD-binding monooxygenase [Pseudonocardia acidicola]
MKIVCVGGGPGGLYFAISAKRRDAGHDITVIERDPPGATYGWGVVYWDNLLDMLFRNDADSARRLRAASRLWEQQQIRLRGQTAWLSGYGFSMGRGTMLDILTQRALDLDIDVQHRRSVEDLSDFADADLIVAADGAGSRVRQQYADDFGTQVDLGRNRYIWLGTDKVFDSFVFAFEDTPEGWMWFHAYPSSAGISTCIVECSPQTWEAHGFDHRDAEDGLQLLEKIFAGHLEGHSFISAARGEPARWLRFMQVRNTTWYHDNVALIGDAAHTTHFTIGSGTRLAMIDAVGLAQSLYNHEDLPTALQEYDRVHRTELRPTQAAARTSMAWFENVDRYTDQNATGLAYAMAARQGQHPPWVYQHHIATQIPVLRRAQHAIDSARRRYLAVRRGEVPFIGAERSAALSR